MVVAVIFYLETVPSGYLAIGVGERKKILCSRQEKSPAAVTCPLWKVIASFKEVVETKRCMSNNNQIRTFPFIPDLSLGTFMLCFWTETSDSVPCRPFRAFRWTYVEKKSPPVLQTQFIFSVVNTNQVQLVFLTTERLNMTGIHMVWIKV